METVADRVNALTAAHHAEFFRLPRPDGSVVVQLHFPDGDVVSGVGATTADAVAQLEARVAAFTAAMAAPTVGA